MKATVLEQRHAGLMRLCIYAVAFSAYFFDRDDVVWRFLRDSPLQRGLEHAAFVVATLMIGAGAWLCTRAEANADDLRRHSRGGLLGDWLYALGLSTLAPLWGCVILIAGESLRLLRLGLAARLDDPQAMKARQWRNGFRRQAAKWGVLLTMLVFTFTLIDRVADDGIAASVALWAVLNWTSIVRRVG